MADQAEQPKKGFSLFGKSKKPQPQRTPSQLNAHVELLAELDSSKANSIAQWAKGAAASTSKRHKKVLSSAASGHSRLSFDGSTTTLPSIAATPTRIIEAPTPPIAAAPPTPEERLIQNICSQIFQRLPHRSGSRGVSSLDSDDFIKRNCASLFDFCRFKLSFVISLLLAELDMVMRSAANPGECVPLPALRSQVLLLRILAHCAMYTWAAYRSSQGKEGEDSVNANIDWLDPPALTDEGVARSAVASITLILRQLTAYEGKRQHSHAPSPTTARSPPRPGVKSLFSSSTQSSRASLLPSSSGDVSTAALRASTSEKSSSEQQSLLQDMQRSVAQFTYFISAANWNIVLARLRNRFAYYGSVEDPDLSEIRLLEFCCFNRSRLSTILHELSSTFIHLKRGAQVAISIALRSSIWSWIESYPSQFHQLYESEQRMEGSPDILFDVCYAMTESVKRKPILFPLCTMLLVICPDLISKLNDGQPKNALAKKHQFLETLRKSAKSTKLSDTVALCYLDFCRAAAAVEESVSDLRPLVLDMELDLRTRLVESPRLFTADSGQIDVSLLSQAYATLYKLNPTSVNTHLLPAFSSHAASSSQKLALIKAVASLSSGFASTDVDMTAYADPLRQIFTSSVESLQLSGAEYPSTSREDVGSRSSMEGPQSQDIIEGALAIWRKDISLLLPSNPHDLASLPAISTMVRLIEQRDDSKLALLAIRTLSLLEDRIDPNHLKIRNTLISHGSTTIFQLCSQALDSSNSAFQMTRIFELLGGRLQSLVLLASAERFEPALPSLDELIAMFTATELACIVGTWTPGSSLRSAIYDCLESLVALQASPNYRTMTFHSLLSNFSVIGQTNPTGDTTRSRLENYSLCSVASVAGMAAFSEGLRRFPLLLATLCQSREFATEDSSDLYSPYTMPEVDSQTAEEWTNISKYLVGFSAQATTAADLPALEQVMSKDCVPSRFYEVINPPARQAVALVQEMVDLLVCDQLFVSDGVRDILSSCLPPSLVPVVLLQMAEVFKHFRDDVTNTRPDDSLMQPLMEWILQAIQTLACLFERLSNIPLSSSETDLANSLVIEFVQHAHRTDFGASESLMIWCCNLVYSICGPVARQTVLQDPETRLVLVNYFMCWAAQAEIPSLQTACIRALKSLLTDLAIMQHRDPTAHYVPTADFQSFCRIRAFFIHFSSVITADPVLEHLTSASFAELIAANVECEARWQSLQHSADATPITTLKSYVLAMEKLPRSVETKPTRQESFDRLFVMISESPLLLSAIIESCSSSDYDDMAEIVLKILERQHVTVKALCRLIDEEVKNSTHAPTLFRGNSFTTRLLTSYVRAKGFLYLRAALTDLVTSVCQRPAEYKIEANGVDLSVAKNVDLLGEAFLTVIDATWSSLPSSIRQICAYLKQAVENKWPTSGRSAVGGLIFLRFINPAIASPAESLCIDTPVDRESRRGLLAVSKLLQNLSNNSSYKAEDSMHNATSTLHNKMMDAFLHNISKGSNATRQDQNVLDILEDDIDDHDLRVFSSFLSTHHDQLGNLLLSRRTTTDKSAATGADVWNSLTHLLFELGPAEQNFNFSSTTDFLLASEACDDAWQFASWSAMFFECGTSKNDRKSFYMHLASIDGQTTNILSLTRYIIKQPTSSGETHVDLVLDASQFNQKNEVDGTFIDFLTRVFSNVPFTVATVYILHPNIHLHRFLRFLGARLDLSRTIVPIASFKQFEEYFDTTSSGLHIPSTLLEDEVVDTCVQAVMMRGFRQPPSSVSVSLNKWMLVIRYGNQERDLLGTVKARFTDMYELAKITKVQRIATNAGPITLVKFHEESPLIFQEQGQDSVYGALCAARLSPMAEHSPIITCKRDHWLIANIYAALQQLMIGNTVQIRRLARALIEESFTLLTGNQSKSSQTNYIPELSQDLAIHLCDTIVNARPDLLDVQLGAAKEVFRNYQATPWLLGPFCFALRPLSVAACTSRSTAIKRSQMVTSLARILGIVAHDPAASVAFSSKCLGAAVKADGFFELVIDVYLASATAFSKSEHELARLASVFISSPICCPALLSKVLHRLLAIVASQKTSLSASCPSYSSILALSCFLRSLIHHSSNVPIATPHLLAEITVPFSLVFNQSTRAIDQVLSNVVLLAMESASAGDSHERLETLQVLMKQTIDARSEDDSGTHRNDVTIINTMLALLRIDTDTAAYHINRMATITSQLAFESSGHYRPRAFVLLGQLLSQDEAIEEELTFQLLVVLKASVDGQPDLDLCAGILHCLANVCHCTEALIPHVHILFRVACGLFQLQHRRLQTVCIHLITLCVNTLSNSDQQISSFSDVYYATQGQICTSWHELDLICGIDLRRHPSYSFALLLMRCQAENLESANALLKTLLALCSGPERPSLAADQVPWLCLLLPYYDIDELFQLGNTAYHRDLETLAQTDMTNPENDLLTAGLLANAANATENQHSKITLLNVLGSLLQNNRRLVKIIQPMVSATIYELLAGDAVNLLSPTLLDILSSVSGSEADTLDYFKAVGLPALSQQHKIPTYDGLRHISGLFGEDF